MLLTNSLITEDEEKDQMSQDEIMKNRAKLFMKKKTPKSPRLEFHKFIYFEIFIM